VLGAGASLEFAEAACAIRVHVLDALQDPGFFGHLAKFLIDGGLLNDQLGLAVDGACLPGIV
jgi:hypothetical protein